MEKGEIILYQPNETIKLEVRLNQETVWLSIDEMAILFDRDKSVIGKTHSQHLQRRRIAERISLGKICLHCIRQ